MIYDDNGLRADGTPGDVLGKLIELRKAVGVLKAKKKDGVRFKVRSADELVDRMRPVANELGLVMYPVQANGTGSVIEGEDKSGTLASVTVLTRIVAVSDGSAIVIAGFGLGVDTQDKAGGKAGTYAMKTAYVQALLAGGAEDTDDTDTPIKGGPRKAAPKPATKGYEAVKAAFEAASTEAEYRAAVPGLSGISPDQQLAIRETVRAAKARCVPAPEAG